MSAEEEMAALVRAHQQRLDDERREDEEIEQVCRAVVDGLIAARKQRNLSQNQTSKRSGMSQRGMNMIERGSRSPTLRSIIKMARGLDVTLVVGENGQIDVYLGAVEIVARD